MIFFYLISNLKRQYYSLNLKDIIDILFKILMMSEHQNMGCQVEVIKLPSHEEL